MADRRRFWLVVVLPPPVTGMTTVSQWMASALAEFADVHVLPVRKTGAGARAWSLFKHLLLVVNAFRAGYASRPGDFLYFVPDSGSGMIGSTFVAVIARAFRLRLVAHHHVFSYLDAPSLTSRLFFSACGKDALHVVLCGAMQRRLNSAYGPDRRVAVVGNARFVTAPAHGTPRDALKAIGFLGNITEEKGIHLFLLAAELAQDQVPSLRAVIAGPISSPSVKERVEHFVAQSPRTREWRGPVYDAAKEKFFADIDALLFPTQYRNEAEPLTIYEALVRGVPVLATARGCIAEQLPTENVVEDAGVFAQWAAHRLIDAANSPASYAQMAPPRRSIPFGSLERAMFPGEAKAPTANGPIGSTL